MTNRTAKEMREDLLQDPIAGAERLGIALLRYASSYTQSVIVLTEYKPLPPGAYAKALGAPVGFDVRWFMAEAESAASRNAGICLVHLHDHYGMPWFSSIDMRTNKTVLLPISNIDHTMPTGAVVFSRDRIAALLGLIGKLVEINVAEVPG